MTAKSKIKGNAGERELCKLLTEIFGGSFVRVPNSGANVGGKNVQRRQALSITQDRAFRGDIIPPDHLPRLIVESKSYKDFRFHQLLQPGPAPMLDSWIKQTIDIIDPYDQWFVAFKIVRIGWYIAIPDSECSDYLFDNHCIYNSPHGRMRVTDMLTFFKTNRDLIAKKAGPTAHICK
jgi:hypothetical protein